MLLSLPGALYLKYYGLAPNSLLFFYQKKGNIIIVRAVGMARLEQVADYCWLCRLLEWYQNFYQQPGTACSLPSGKNSHRSHCQYWLYTGGVAAQSRWN